MNLSTFNSQFSILILNGANLNRLGTRKPEIYGTKTMAQILLEIQKKWPEVHFVYRQSNHEGELIDWIQSTNDGTGVGSGAKEAAGVGSGAGNAAELPNDGTGVGSGAEKAVLNDIAGVVLNAGGYSHTSVALRDAVEECEVPVVEVHISDIRKREAFRQVSLLTDVCAHSIIGHGTDGYAEAVEWLIEN